jgi:hypothetical protein
VIVSVANFTGTFSGAEMSNARPVILSSPRIINTGFDGVPETVLPLDGTASGAG